MAHQILIVESDIQDSEHVDAALASFSYEIAGRAANRDEALQLAKDTRSDLAIVNMDLRAHEEGFVIARELREQLHIPVIFISPYSNLAIMRRACASGCFGYLSKPLRMSELDATIRIALHQHSVSLRTFAKQSWLTSVFDSLSDGVIATSEDGVVRFLNPAAQVLTGWMPIEAIGKPIEEVYSLLDIDQGKPVEECQIRKILNTRSPVGKQRFLLATRFGSHVPLEESASPILDGTTLMGAVTIFTNITARITAERATGMEIDELKDKINVSHSALTRSHDELTSLTERLIDAQEEERRRIARELHDDLAQRAALINLHMDQMIPLFEVLPMEKHPDIVSLKAMLSDLADGIRNMSHLLHPTIVEDLGLPAALDSLVRDYRVLGMDIAVSIQSLPDALLPPIAFALYRIVQEALHNTLRHAPGALAKVSLSSTDDTLYLSIEDAGPGFSLTDAKRTSGLGLLSMQERARIVGGSFLLRTNPGEGTAISVTVPVRNTYGPQKGSPR